MNSLTVRSLGGDRFTIDIRGFGVEVDQPLSHAGTDLAPTPTELFVASLASCVGFYAERYLRRHSLSTERLGVTCRYEMSQGAPNRVTGIDLELEVPRLPSEKREVLLKVVDHCTVHNTLQQPPEVRVSLAVKPE